MVVSGVHLIGGPPFAPGVGKIAFVVTNSINRPVDALVTCNVLDGSGRVIATSAFGPWYLAAKGRLDTFVGFETTGTPGSAACRATALPPVPPPSSPPSSASFLPSSVAFWTAERGVTIGVLSGPQCDTSCPSLIETTADGGRTWTIRLRTTTQARSLTVSGTESAWVTLDDRCADVCPSILMGSGDGGVTWRRLNRGVISSPSLVSPRVGFAVLTKPPVGDQPFGELLIVRTQDGGRTWGQPSPAPCRGGDWGEGILSFPTPQYGWLVCVRPSLGNQSNAKAVYRTTDGGRSWTTLQNISTARSEGGLGPFDTPTGLFFLPDGHGWLLMARSQSFTTTDGGASWTPMTITPHDETVEAWSVWFTSDRQGYVLLNLLNGRFVLDRTEDGGRTWRTVRSWIGAG